MSETSVSPIPSYLTSLARLAKRYGTHAKGMHSELELLASFPWDQAPLVKREEVSHFEGVEWTDFVEYESGITPGDMARGWVACARVHAAKWATDEIAYCAKRAIDRAAACAELAALSGACVLQLPSGRECLSTLFLIRGKIEGARLAWDFIFKQMLVVEGYGRAGCIVSTDPARPFDAAFQDKIADGARAYAETYRRELEAMK